MVFRRYGYYVFCECAKIKTYPSSKIFHNHRKLLQKIRRKSKKNVDTLLNFRTKIQTFRKFEPCIRNGTSNDKSLLKLSILFI